MGSFTESSLLDELRIDELRPRQPIPQLSPSKDAEYRLAYALGSRRQWEFAEIDKLSRSMVATTTNTAAPEVNSGIPAGYTYFGQLIAHDLTRMTAQNRLGQEPEPGSVSDKHALPPTRFVNRTSAALDLDCVYGHGPVSSPALYSKDRSTSGHFVLGRGPARFVARGRGRHNRRRVPGDDDVLRTSAGFATIADPRNDENFLVSQIHLALQKAHNSAMAAQGGGRPQHARFERARSEIRWQYQHAILEDFLPTILHPSVRDTLRTWDAENSDGDSVLSALVDRWRVSAWVPLEFAVAGFRFGHSMVRDRYRLNRRNRREITILPSSAPRSDTGDLGGERPIPATWTLDWDFFFSRAQDGPGQFAHRIRPEVNFPLGRLPIHALSRFSDEEQLQRLSARLPFRTLARGAQVGLPSGPSLARQFAERKRDVKVYAGFEFGTDCPLWYYILAEAQEERSGAGDGGGLGRLGSWIVVDTLYGLLRADPTSVLHAAREFDRGRTPKEFEALLRSAWPKSN